MKKAKILYVITQSEWGGAQKYVFDLAFHLRDDYEILVACGGDGALVEKLLKEEISVFVLKNLVRPVSLVSDVKAFWALCRLIKKIKPDFVHSNSSKAEVIGNLAALLCKTPVVFTAHGFVCNEPMLWVKKKFFIWLERIVNFRSRKIICVSEYDKATALRYKIGSVEKIVMIHNGVDAELIEKKRYGEEKSKICVGTVANFYPAKGLEYLLVAAAKLEGRLDNLEFRLIGDGLLHNKIERKISDLGLKNFIMQGAEKDCATCFRQFDIFVLPSIKEGFPYVILEAMAAGLPVVATRSGGVPEAIIDGIGGYIVRTADAESLAEAIEKLVEDGEKRKKFGIYNLKKVRDEFSLELMVKKTREVYEELIG